MIRLRTAGVLPKMCSDSDSESVWQIWLCRRVKISLSPGKNENGATIERLKNASLPVQMIGLADKLSNMRDIDRDYPAAGEQLWTQIPYARAKKPLPGIIKKSGMCLRKILRVCRLTKSTVV